MTGATALASFLILLTIVSGIGNYGADGVLRYSFPVFELSRKAQIPFILQSFALFFSATWLSQVLVATGLFYFLLAEGAAQWLQVLNYKWFTLILFPPVFFLILFPAGVIGERVIASYLRVGSSLFTVGLVLVLVIVAIFRRAGDQEDVS